MRKPNTDRINQRDTLTDKEYCNQCGFETKHDENGCINHQKTLYDSEGVPYQRYDEFNQDGEEL